MRDSPEPALDAPVPTPVARTAEEARAGWDPPGLAPAVAALLLLLGLAGALASPARYHGDERFYTDAALAMRETGDYLLPRYADGAPRLAKPLLAYWVVAGSQRILGVGLVSARLGFALSAGALVVLLGRSARRLTGDPRLAAFAALLLAANVDVLTLGGRSTPDVLVCLAVLLALDGAARVLLEGATGRGGALAFWAGAGLAGAAKGLWGALVVAFVLGGAALARIERARIRRLLDLPALALGAGLAATGIAPLLFAGLEPVVRTGGSDQLQASPSLATVLHNLEEYGRAPLDHFLPWSVLLGLACLSRRARRAMAATARQPFVRAAVLWWLVLMAVFLLGSQRRVRYLAPAHAGLVLAMAALLWSAAGVPRVGERLRGAAAGLASLVALPLLAFGTLALLRGATPAWGLVAVGAGATALAARAWRAAPRDGLLASAWSLLFVSLGFVGLARPMLASSPLPAIAERVEEAATSDVVPMALDGLDRSVLARLRLLSGGRIRPGDGLPTPPFVLADAPAAEPWLARGYAPVADFDAPATPRADDLLAWLRGERESPRPRTGARWRLLAHAP